MSTILVGFEPERFSESYRMQIQEIAPDMRLLVTEDREEMEAALDDIEIAACQFPRDLLLRARNLRWYQQWAAGANWLLRYPEAIEKDFVLTNASGVHPIPISEHIFALLLALGRRIDRSVRAQMRAEWLGWDEKRDVFELADKTMVLIGVGAIGERTAQVAVAFDMRVVGVRRNPEHGAAGVETMVGPARLLDHQPSPK